MLRSLDKQTLILFLLFVFLIIFAYLALPRGYRPDNPDDAWSLSFAYNYINKGRVDDQVFGHGGPSPDRFGVIACVIYGGILNLIGWTKINAFFLSTLIILSTFPFWFMSARSFGLTRKKALFFILLLALLEPTFRAAHTGRTDALVFFFISLSFFLFIRKKFFWAGFTALLGMEVHPSAAFIFFYMLGFWIGEGKRFLPDRQSILRAFARFIPGFLLGVGFYFYLHAQYIASLITAVNRYTGEYGNLFYAYFVTTTWAFRHIPELLVFLASFVLYFFLPRLRKRKTFLVTPLLMILASFLLKRGNYHYMLYVYPAFLLLSVSVFHTTRRTLLLALYFFVSMSFQYGYMYYRWGNSRFTEDFVSQVKPLIPDDAAPIFGNANGWFAFPERDYYYYSRLADSTLQGEEFYLIDTMDRHYTKRPETDHPGYTKERIADFTYEGGECVIYRYKTISAGS